jgi:diaminohydroxyphosphoribosylaminopyrimidine deaminase / 5-amino-6-(5-phosphoribosylamino)uracil reductase
VSDPAAADLRWLDVATRLAMPALGTTGPTPPVGAVVADPAAGQLAGRAVTQLRGAGQAELLALADTQGTSAGRTLYLTLEPPSASAAAIAEAGIFRVVVAQLDPDPAASGAGLRALGERNIETLHLPYEPARVLIEGYAMRLAKSRPFVTMKVTVSADSMVGHNQPGGASPVGVEAARFIDRERAASDAVLSGIARAEVEDSDLRPHLPGLDDRTPLRVVLAGNREMNAAARVFADPDGAPILLFTTPEHPVSMRRGISVVQVEGRRGHPDLRKVVNLLAVGGINHLFVEAGARLAESFIAAELIDRLYVIDSAVTVGRFGVPAALLGRFHERISAARYSEVDRLILGEDKVRTFERR